MFDTFLYLVRITRSSSIMRRYFVVNGFDGALTTLGLIIGFRTAGGVDVPVAMTACLGAAIALAVSGVSSAYISEAAERRRELRELEQAMMADLGEAAHGLAARFVPVLIALVNGLAPLLVALLIIAPLWAVMLGAELPPSPFDWALASAFAVIFLLGVFLGRVSERFWLWSGLRAVLIGALTAILILAVAP